jgi:hypothetical protein
LGLPRTTAKSRILCIEASDGAESENYMEISDVNYNDSDFVACDPLDEELDRTVINTQK